MSGNPRLEASDAIQNDFSVDDVTIATILNHSWPLRHMTAVYNRWERLPEMKRALERWGVQVERIVTGEGTTKVVTFKR